MRENRQIEVLGGRRSRGLFPARFDAEGNEKRLGFSFEEVDRSLLQCGEMYQ
jgi:hypothetical protein